MPQDVRFMFKHVPRCSGIFKQHRNVFWQKSVPVRTYVIAHGLKWAYELCYTIGELR